jgi:hypothetical protein
VREREVRGDRNGSSALGALCGPRTTLEGDADASFALSSFFGVRGESVFGVEKDGTFDSCVVVSRVLGVEVSDSSESCKARPGFDSSVDGEELARAGLGCEANGAGVGFGLVLESSGRLAPVCER